MAVALATPVRCWLAAWAIQSYAFNQVAQRPGSSGNRWIRHRTLRSCARNISMPAHWTRTLFSMCYGPTFMPAEARLMGNIMYMKSSLMFLLTILSACSTQIPAPLLAQHDAGSYRDEKLAQYLVGTWYNETISSTEITESEQTYKADGTFSGTFNVYRLPTITSIGILIKGTFSGIWHVEGDISIETGLEMSMPLFPLPNTGKYRNTDIQPDQYTSEDVSSGKKNVPRRKPLTTGQHSQVFNKPWPEPFLTDAWIQFHKDSTGIEYYDKLTIQRYDDIVGVWIRGDMSEAAISEAREHASKDRSGLPALIMEKTLIYKLVDCKRKLIKPRDIRIYSGGRLVAASKYEGEDPMNWSRIKAMDDSEIELMKITC